ncbi:MAG: hypothetical protein L6408_00995 [Nanoarchaeota archaeon]|nr:hypothetical protein [Nanoarchaeota archaeon]
MELLLLPAIVYLNYSINAYADLPSFTLWIFIFCLMMLSGLGAIFGKKKISLLFLITFSSLVVFVPIAASLYTPMMHIKPLETILFSIAFLCFIELNTASNRFSEIKERYVVKSYLTILPLLLLIICLLSFLVLGFNLVIALLSIKLAESAELNSVYGITLSMIIVFGVCAIIRLGVRR